MSSARQAVARLLNFTGLGYRPDLIPAHHVVLPTGISFKIVERRIKPVSGSKGYKIESPLKN